MHYSLYFLLQIALICPLNQASFLHEQSSGKHTFQKKIFERELLESVADSDVFLNFGKDILIKSGDYPLEEPITLFSCTVRENLPDFNFLSQVMKIFSVDNLDLDMKKIPTFLCKNEQNLQSCQPLNISSFEYLSRVQSIPQEMILELDITEFEYPTLKINTVQEKLEFKRLLEGVRNRDFSPICLRPFFLFQNVTKKKCLLFPYLKKNDVIKVNKTCEGNSLIDPSSHNSIQFTNNHFKTTTIPRSANYSKGSLTVGTVRKPKIIEKTKISQVLLLNSSCKNAETSSASVKTVKAIVSNASPKTIAPKASPKTSKPTASLKADSINPNEKGNFLNSKLDADCFKNFSTDLNQYANNTNLQNNLNRSEALGYIINNYYNKTNLTVISQNQGRTSETNFLNKSVTAEERLKNSSNYPFPSSQPVVLFINNELPNAEHRDNQIKKVHGGKMEKFISKIVSRKVENLMNKFMDSMRDSLINKLATKLHSNELILNESVERSQNKRDNGENVKTLIENIIEELKQNTTESRTEVLVIKEGDSKIAANISEKLRSGKTQSEKIRREKHQTENNKSSSFAPMGNKSCNKNSNHSTSSLFEFSLDQDEKPLSFPEARDTGFFQMKMHIDPDPVVLPQKPVPIKIKPEKIFSEFHNLKNGFFGFPLSENAKSRLLMRDFVKIEQSAMDELEIL